MGWTADNGERGITNQMDAPRYKFSTVSELISIEGIEVDRAESQIGGAEHRPVAMPAFIPSDPLFSPEQWHLQNPTSEPDINVVDVWDDYTGAGVVVGVIDSGVQHTHYDLNDNYNHDLDFDALDGDNDAAPPNNQGHGTSVAGVIAAEQNGLLGVGVAFGAEVAGFRMGFGAQGSVAQETASFEKQVDVDVSNNSWGYNGFFFDNFDDPSNFGFDDSGAAIENAVATGRGGLGTVVVFAAGNSRADGQDANYHSYQNSPYTIAVAAAEIDGTVATSSGVEFSTPGAPILVSAGGRAIVTTDMLGSGGFVNGDAVSINGTSFSSPTVAGVVALMLEANPNLGYRDIQQIIAYSAQQNHSNSPGWEFNGATNWNGGGLHVSHDYG